MYGIRKLYLSQEMASSIVSLAPPLSGKSPKVLLLGETTSPSDNNELPYRDRSMWSILKVALGLSDNTSLSKVQKAGMC